MHEGLLWADSLQLPAPFFPRSHLFSWWERPFDLRSSVYQKLVPQASECKGAIFSLCTDEIFMPPNKLARARGQICCALCLQFHWRTSLACAFLSSTSYMKSHHFLERSWHQVCSACCSMVPSVYLLKEKGCPQMPDVDGKSSQTEELRHSHSYLLEHKQAMILLFYTLNKWKPKRKVFFFRTGQKSIKYSRTSHSK